MTLLTVVALVIGCQGAATNSPPESATTAPSLTPTVSPVGTASTGPSASNGAAAHWEATGAMAIGRAVPHLVVLGDGRVLAAGNDDGSSQPWVRDDSATVELWDPATGAWHATQSLNQPRSLFAAVPLADGRALVTAGLDQPVGGCDAGGAQLSYSSTYLYDGRSGNGSWTRSGLLNTARTNAAAAVLPDGRVLVAGGYYYTGQTADLDGGPRAALAAYRPGSIAQLGPLGMKLFDVIPPTVASALATAELFDPASGTWSATGHLTYARFGAASATLADGRVLVVGSASGDDGGVAKVDARAYDSAELFDPKSGRFALTGSLPAIDRSASGQLGQFPEGDPTVDANGTLIALQDGGALLVGRSAYWKHQGEITRSFRYDAASGRWTEIGRAWGDVNNPPAGAAWTTSGPRYGVDSLVARLPDGRVLVAGGSDAAYAVTSAAELYDPATNAWSALPAMPEARAAGAAVALSDGSVLLVGGYNDQTTRGSCDGSSGLATAVRFVPAR
ncbi:MAG: hypothetical protein ACXWN5_02990 [Candidatus Limnocylindrales bacterium]